MSWQELVDTLRPAKPPAHINLLLCGRAASRLPRLPGPPLSDKEFVTFHRAKFTGKGDELTGILDVIRLVVPEETLAKHATLEQAPTVTIVALDWMDDVSAWPSALREALETVQPDSKLILTAVNFEKATKTWPSSALLSEKIDACHQFLRVSALVHKASLIYTLQNDIQVDWLAIVSHVCGVAFVPRPAPPQQLVADPVFAVYDGQNADTKEHILALNPAFDYDAATEGKLELAPLAEAEAVAEEQKPELSLEAILAEFDEKNQDARLTSDTATESQKLVYDGIGTGASEDRRVISEFFTKIAQRST